MSFVCNDFVSWSRLPLASSHVVVYHLIHVVCNTIKLSSLSCSTYTTSHLYSFAAKNHYYYYILFLSSLCAIHCTVLNVIEIQVRRDKWTDTTNVKNKNNNRNMIFVCACGYAVPLRTKENVFRTSVKLIVTLYDKTTR